jgi:hypothetical protein
LSFSGQQYYEINDTAAVED